MSTIILPTRTDAARYTREYELDKTSFKFEFSWNDRAASWYFDLYDADNAPLLMGRRIVVGYPLISRFRDPRMPAGELSAIDTSDANLDPLYGDLGDRVLLMYTEASDMDSSVLL